MRTWICLLAVVFALALCAQGQEIISLNGQWSIAAEAPINSAPSWVPILVPSAWESALGLEFDGVACYRRLLPLASRHRDMRLSIVFRAAATHATVSCNGREIGTHLGGWTPFRVELAADLHFDGTDLLEVKLDERVGHNTQGFLPIIQPHFGGLWQSVELHLDRGPTLDRLELFHFGRADGSLRSEVRFRAGHGALGPWSVEVIVGTEAGESTVRSGPRTASELVRLDLHGLAVGAWSPATPRLHEVTVRLLDRDGHELDRIVRQVGFRTFTTDQTRLIWNGSPLQVRGILHWGYSPPHLAPPEDPEFWRRQLIDFRSLGFNLIKCCLWVPPRCVYELCDELGLIVWQEYPTWHPKMDVEHRVELVAEYGEFFRHDRGHASVAIRSLTCETGHGADLSVIQELYNACHAAVPDTIVVDDSSWIGWQRVADFWDEHPYGNNRWWPGRLQDFKKHIAEKGAKPLLLGECLAADTWVDRRAWTERHGTATRWWRPDCFMDQTRFEAWMVARFGRETLDSLAPISRDFGLRNRKFQIERLRATIPEAGYVVSVARDFAKARMGLYDDFDAMKWNPDDFAWQRDIMLSLMTEGDARAFVGPIRLPIVGTNFSAASAVGRLRLEIRGAGDLESYEAAIRWPPGGTGEPVVFEPKLPIPTAPRRLQLHARFEMEGPAANHWSIWQLPLPPDEDPATTRLIHRLDEEALDYLEAGGRALLLVLDERPNLESEGMWLLKGSPFAPAHSFHARVPRDLLLELSSFDLESGRVIPWPSWGDEVSPILAFWETHDIPEVRAHLLAFDTRVGEGRLAVSVMNHATPAGGYVQSALRQHLAEGPPSPTALSRQTLAALRADLRGTTIDLLHWRFATDPKDLGVDEGWMREEYDDRSWRSLKSGAHWEPQGVEHYDGVGWYRLQFVAPESYRDLDARLICEGIDDSATVWINGEEVGRFGDPATKTTVWLERSVLELGRRLRPSAANSVVLRVVDHAGAGGLWKPVFLTTRGAVKLLVH